MNQLISSAVGEKLASLLTVEYLRERGDHGKRSAYERILRRVRDVAPQERDALPDKRLEPDEARLRSRFCRAATPEIG